MDDQLDNRLKDHIKEVFDNFEDTSVDEGWLLLREKFPGERAKRGASGWMWWSAAAAILLVFSGIGLWIINTPDNPVNQIVKINGAPKRENQPIKRTREDTTANTALIAKKSINSNQFAPNYQSAPIRPMAGTGTATSQNGRRIISGLPLTDSALRVASMLKKSVDTLKRVVKPTNIVSPVNKAQQTQLALANVPAKPANNTTQPQLAAGDQPKDNLPQSLVIQNKKPAKTITDMFNSDKGTKASKDDEDLPSKRVHFGIYAATYFNYSKGSDNQVNMGAGVSTDIKLNKNLKLVTGVAIAQNSLSYAGVPDVPSLKNSLVVPASFAAMTYTALSTPTVKTYNASLVGLDIPINLKYEFNPQKTDAYISMGLSSGTFIDESYTYKYNYPSLASQALSQTKNETSDKNFNSFYFAKTLNLAFGIGYPFGKNRLVIEPFVKYPLDGLGSQNLKFGAGGLNLKFNFLSAHK